MNGNIRTRIGWSVARTKVILNEEEIPSPDELRCNPEPHGETFDWGAKKRVIGQSMDKIDFQRPYRINKTKGIRWQVWWFPKRWKQSSCFYINPKLCFTVNSLILLIKQLMLLLKITSVFFSMIKKKQTSVVFILKFDTSQFVVDWKIKKKLCNH